MDFIDFTISFTIFYNLAIFGCFFVICLKITNYVLNLHNMEFTTIEWFFTLLTFGFVGFFLLPYILIVVFDLIMYIFYIIITTIIPETGIQTFFIPVRELLMKIPPLKKFETRGIFRLFTNILVFFGMSERLAEALEYLFDSYYNFSKNDSYNIIKLFNPHINIDKFQNLVENMNNNNKKSELNNINNDIDVCVGSSSKLTTPDMNYVNILKNNIDDMKSEFKCNLNVIPAYIST